MDYPLNLGFLAESATVQLAGLTGLTDERTVLTNLFDGNSGFPGFFLIEDGEANRSRRVDIGMEQRRRELAYVRSWPNKVERGLQHEHLGGFEG